MGDKLKVFWNLDVLVKMCRSKSDGPSLRIEEDDIVEKIDSYNQEIEELKTIIEEDSYDTSAEMADRNIEIITKKQLQTLKTNLKEKNKELNALKEEENNLYSNNSLLRDNKASQEKYIASMQERINEATDYEVIDRYNGLIAETTEKISKLVDDLEEQNLSYEKVQKDIIELSEEIANIEEKIDKKKKLLAETQANLENKENYIDKAKKDKNNKKIHELELKVQKATKRLEEIRKDPKYIETKIKDIINSKEDIENAKPYFIELVNIVIRQPYINVPADNALEEELLKATQARDTFANEIEQKSYNILEADTPEKIRIDFLNERISLWNKELEDLNAKVDIIDRDREYRYEEKNRALTEMIQTMKADLKEFQKAYEEAPDHNVGAKASIKAALDEKKTDIIEAEKIATAFKKDESEDISRATRTIKYECERITQSIKDAKSEIDAIKTRLTSKKSGLIDISSKNKDKDTLKELAQTVIDIKHRRQFPDTPIEIIQRIEEELDIKIMKDIDQELVETSSEMVQKDYEEFNSSQETIKRGVKVVEETEVEPNIEEENKLEEEKMQQAEAELHSLISNIEAAENAASEENDEEAEEGIIIPDLTDNTEEVLIEEQPEEETIQDIQGEETTETLESEQLIETVDESAPIETMPLEEEPVLIEEEIPTTEAPIIVEEKMVATDDNPVVIEEVVQTNEENLAIDNPTEIEEIPQIDDSALLMEEPIVEEIPQETLSEENVIVEDNTTPMEFEQTPETFEINTVEENVEIPEDIQLVSDNSIETIDNSIAQEEPVTVQEPEIISNPIPEETIVETPMVEQQLSDEDSYNDSIIDQEIDSIILSSKGDEADEDDQVLDIDAMFIETSNEQPESIIETKPTAEPTKSKKLSIDSIFNVESDSDTDEDSDNLANDFEQYINNLENKES